MTRQDEHEPYYVLYDTDFGLSGLAGRAPGFEKDEQLGADARSLLESGLPEHVLRTLWRAADQERSDPARSGTTVRSWLRACSDAWPPQTPGRPPFPAGLKDDVLAEIEALAPDLARAAPTDTVPALRRAVAEAGPDLGFRLLLRVLKTWSVRVDKARYDRFIRLSDPFGYPVAVVRDGLAVDWPPLDADRRDSAWDFGLSALTARFAGEWYEATAEEVVRVVAAGDGALQAPGSAAAELLEDVVRLLDSPLPDETLGRVWLAAADGGLGVGPDGAGVRPWLEEVAGICRDRLRVTAPGHHPGAAPARSDLRNAVLSELRDLAPEFASRTVQPHGRALSGADALGALERVVAEVDPDLGFRLLLRVLIVLWVPLDPRRHARYQALGDRFGYGEFHVSDIEGLVDSDL
ncbi:MULTISPECIES: hypothetical protein [unclassified Streptomyces]|uniref:hypothetical protein n=1 Tax=unclassified Streptomyces TaxID=2593676 RepID=UPI0036E0B605